MKIKIIELSKSSLLTLMLIISKISLNRPLSIQELTESKKEIKILEELKLKRIHQGLKYLKIIKLIIINLKNNYIQISKPQYKTKP